MYARIGGSVEFSNSYRGRRGEDQRPSLDFFAFQSILYIASPLLLLHFKNSPFVSLQCCLPSRQPPLESLLLAIDSSSLRLLENHYSEASKVSRIVSSNEWWARLHYSWGKIIRQRNVDRPKESPWRSPRGGGRDWWMSRSCWMEGRARVVSGLRVRNFKLRSPRG